VPIILALANEIGVEAPEDANTAEEIFTTIDPESITKLAQELAKSVTEAVSNRVDGKFNISCALINMQNEIIGHHGDLGKWKNQ
jgi:cobalamin biosynthesis protein CbiD